MPGRSLDPRDRSDGSKGGVGVEELVELETAGGKKLLDGWESWLNLRRSDDRSEPDDILE